MIFLSFKLYLIRHMEIFSQLENMHYKVTKNGGITRAYASRICPQILTCHTFNMFNFSTFYFEIVAILISCDAS